MFLSRLFKKPAIGIDISDYSIEVLQLSKNKGVLAYNRTILEEGIVQDGKIIKKEKLAEKLKEVLENTKHNALQAKSCKLKAILSLPESKIFIHYFELPRNLRGEALREKILEESSKIIPLNQERVYWDYIAIPNKESQRVAYVGALKEIVDEYVEVMRSVGIETVAIDAESLSLSRALMPASHKLQATSSIMIIDIGARTSNASIFNHDKLLALSITIPIAGNNFTRAIVEFIKTKKQENNKTKKQIEENLLIVEAKQLKREFGFDASNPDNRILSILQASFQPIIKGLKEAISHYENNRGEKIEEIILAGGSALLPKIDEYLAANLERKVKIGDPLKQIGSSQLADKKHSPILFANVVGLALRSIGDISKGINLLPQKQENIKTLKHKINKTKVALLLFCFIAFLIGFVIYQNFFMPFIQEAQTGEYPKEFSSPEEIHPHAKDFSVGVKVDSPKAEELVPAPKENKFPAGQVSPSPESELLPMEEGNATEAKEMIVIQDTPTGWLNVRKGPGASYEKVTRVNPGETYTLLEEKDKWYKIKIPARNASQGDAGGDEETQGWVTSQYAIKQ